jgi:hypothetical protein
MTWTADTQGRGDRAFRELLWNVTAVVTVVLGSVCAFLTWGRVVVIYGLVGWILLGLLAALIDLPAVRRPVRIAARALAYAVAAAGLVAMIGWAGVVWVMLVAAAHPALERQLSRRLGAADPAAGDQAANRTNAPRRDAPAVPSAGAEATVLASAGLPDPDGITGLDDETLCQAWRRSFVHLATCRLPARRLEIVHLRQVYLDELARRHPVEVRRWLASGARAASNPMRFVDKSSRGVGDDLSWPEAG